MDRTILQWIEQFNYLVQYENKIQYNVDFAGKKIGFTENQLDPFISKTTKRLICL